MILKDHVQVQLMVEGVVYVETESDILVSVATGLYKLKESET